MSVTWHKEIYLHLCSNYMACFVVLEVCCGELNLLLVLRKGAGMLHIKTHLDDVINVNNSHPFTLQNSTGSIESRECRCELRRLLLCWGLLHLAQI